MPEKIASLLQLYAYVRTYTSYTYVRFYVDRMPVERSPPANEETSCRLDDDVNRPRERVVVLHFQQRDVVAPISGSDLETRSDGA
jgi:hypothetical protein